MGDRSFEFPLECGTGTGKLSGLSKELCLDSDGRLGVWSIDCVVAQRGRDFDRLLFDAAGGALASDKRGGGSSGTGGGSSDMGESIITMFESPPPEEMKPESGGEGFTIESLKRK